MEAFFRYFFHIKMTIFFFFCKSYYNYDYGFDYSSSDSDNFLGVFDCFSHLFFPLNDENDL